MPRRSHTSPFFGSTTKYFLYASMAAALSPSAALTLPRHERSPGSFGRARTAADSALSLGKGLPVLHSFLTCKSEMAVFSEKAGKYKHTMSASKAGTRRRTGSFSLGDNEITIPPPHQSTRFHKATALSQVFRPPAWLFCRTAQEISPAITSPARRGL